jgi:hypothetical protein
LHCTLSTECISLHDILAIFFGDTDYGDLVVMQHKAIELVAEYINDGGLGQRKN